MEEAIPGILSNGQIERLLIYINKLLHLYGYLIKKGDYSTSPSLFVFFKEKMQNFY